MKFINKDFDLLNEKDQKKILNGSIIPRPVAWISTMNKDGLINLAPFSFFNMVSSSLVVISIQKIDGQNKDTLNNLLLNKEGVINIANTDLLRIVDLTSKVIPSNESEIDLTNLTLTNSLKVNVPGILEAPIRLEVKLENTLDLPNYNNTQTEATLVVLRVISASLNPNVYDEEKGYILADKLKPISRISGPNYATIDIIKGFKRNF